MLFKKLFSAILLEICDSYGNKLPYVFYTLILEGVY